MTRAMTSPDWTIAVPETRFRRRDFAGGERPIVGKRLLQARHHRAFDAEMQVLNGAFGFVGEHVAWRMFMPPVKAVWPSTTRILR